MKKVERETPEYKTMKSEGVRKGSARYEILIAKMHKRIKAAAKAAAAPKPVIAWCARATSATTRGWQWST